jgi:hypothetical protein
VLDKGYGAATIQKQFSKFHHHNTHVINSNTNKMKPLDLLLTKEAFDQYAKRLREEKAKEYGMTLEEWDAAILNGTAVSPNTQPSSSLNNTK